MPPPLTDHQLCRMAWMPSHRAPRAADVLRPPPFAVPPLYPEEARLLAAVAADPDADEPRLAFADWCAANGDRGWPARLAPFGAADIESVRGFPEAMSLAGRSFISLGGELVKRVPLRGLRLVAVAPFMHELADCPHLARIERLSLAGNRVGPDGVRELARSPHLASLAELDLSRNDLGPDGVRELLAAAWLPRLRSLTVTDNGLSPADLAALPSAVVGTT